ncbi:MAG TPA: lipoate--protein ligase family protein [Candidatus Limnocylindria bacterium]|nr:lipoate--protein ligase family protein [Candidatus Limnocylindria bacterium]
MKFLNLTLDTPAENLACDEALLDLCEAEGVETLRLWESGSTFVVVGYANKVESEVNVEECRRRQVPILRRCSGGGTVVQGPGCLNYNLTLRIPEDGPLTTVTGTNELVMERNRAALEKLLGVNVAIKGHTDLAFANPNDLAPSRTSKIAKPKTGWLKFSGNAQRRRRHALVLHGTILHHFDLSLIDALLRFPSAQPDYRGSRGHAEFVQNISAPPDRLRETLRRAWNAQEVATIVPQDRATALVQERYSRDDWNLRR